MHEVEIKLHYPSEFKESLLQYLNKNGYRYLSCERQIDEYYNHPARDFVKTDEAFRIRTVIDQEKYNECSVVTYKGKNFSECGQSREELECEIYDRDTMKKILERLGFSSVEKVDKERIIYKKEDISVCLDEVKNLGCYIEIESICSENEKADAERRLKEMLEEFSFIPFSFERKTYLDLLLDK